MSTVVGRRPSARVGTFHFPSERSMRSFSDKDFGAAFTLPSVDSMERSQSAGPRTLDRARRPLSRHRKGSAPRPSANQGPRVCQRCRPSVLPRRSGCTFRETRPTPFHETKGQTPRAVSERNAGLGGRDARESRGPAPSPARGNPPPGRNRCDAVVPTSWKVMACTTYWRLHG
jgi:hypothetical protein